MEYRREIGHGEVFLECDAQYGVMAQVLIEKLGELDRRGPALKDGSRIQYGWSLLVLRSVGGNLQVCEPDFDRDPLHDLRPNLDTTLGVLKEQSGALSRAGLAGMDIRFSDEIFTRNKALESANLFLKREEPSGEGDSGWYVGRLEDLEAEGSAGSPEIIRAADLLHRRRSLLKVLTFPPGYVVVMEGDEISEILDRNGKNYWPDRNRATGSRDN